MKILVTGGGGYIGVVLCERLLDAGHEVRILDRLYWGVEPLAALLPRVELVQGDVRAVTEAALESIDAVVHLAGLSNDPTAEYNPQANWEMNAVATEALARACKTRGIKRFSFGSSASLYDGLGPGAHDETAELAPRGAYSKAKFAAEQSLLRLADADFAPVILRQGTVYGYSPRLRLDLVVNTFAKDAFRDGVLYLHGGGTMWRPLVAIGDVAEAHLRALEAPLDSVRGQIFNVVHANLQIRSLAELVAHAHALRRRHVRIEDAPLPKLVRDYRRSNRKLADVLGFAPEVTVLEAIKDLIVRLPREPDDARFYNIRWMTALEESLGSSIWETASPTSALVAAPDGQVVSQRRAPRPRA
jgi:nucleoside-diphosphate-sugar epimerase